VSRDAITDTAIEPGKASESPAAPSSAEAAPANPWATSAHDTLSPPAAPVPRAKPETGTRPALSPAGSKKPETGNRPALGAPPVPKAPETAGKSMGSAAYPLPKKPDTGKRPALASGASEKPAPRPDMTEPAIRAAGELAEPAPDKLP
jgi:hypothetical protein